MSEVCVRVALRVRPLLSRELLHDHRVCVQIVPGCDQVIVGSDRLFSFDHAFGPTATQDEVYDSCVQPLVESVLRGHNATVFFYGQTGSGKTYTFGGRKLDEEGGVIDRVAENVFSLLGEKKENNDGVEATVRISYLELYLEELRDLLESPNTHKELHIRENNKGNTVVVGAKEVVVTSAEELLTVLETGNALRHIKTTGMNEHSSRSHTILTLQIVQCSHINNPSLKTSCFSKLCLVDLAGSERAGKTGNEGSLLKESAHINTGLLALGNVIRALYNRARNNCNSTHIPYRDAKITRLLQDSLGGTAQTVMVACVSPSHHNIAETVGVLQFASKARHIRNCLTATPTRTEVKLCPTTWDPGEVRRGELEYEVRTLGELLKEKEREIEMQRTDGRAAEEKSIRKSSQMRLSERDQKMNPYHLLTQEAAALLADLSGPFLSHSFRGQLQDWQDRLAVVAKAHPIDDEVRDSEGDGDEADHVTILQLRQDLHGPQEALNIAEQLLEQKDAELRQVQKDFEKLLHKSKTYLQALEEEKERNRLQIEHLVDQQILINGLRSNIMTSQVTISGAAVEAVASGNSDKRPHSVPLMRHSCGPQSPRMIHTSSTANSLERVMAAFKVRGHLLLAKLDEKEEVRCPFIKQTESKDSVQETEEKEGEGEEEEDWEEDDFGGKMAFRRSLNQTWTNKNPLVQQSQQVTGTEGDLAKLSHVRKRRLRVSVTQRRIQDLSFTMDMGVELIKELDKTDKEIQAADRRVRQSQDGREAGILVKPSMQSRQVRSQVYHSLQHMRLQREQLQASLRQQRQTANNNTEPGQSGEQTKGDLSVCTNHWEGSNKKTHGSSWWEQQEELVLQNRAELQELEEEQRKREEVIQRREACLQQKKKLELKMLRASKALSQDLLRVSVQLESLEENLQSSGNTRMPAGVTTEELEEERDMLQMRKDTLEAQLMGNRGLTVTESHSLLQLEEASEALDVALEFKNHFILDKQKKLSSSYQSQSTEPAQLCDVIRKLKELSMPEAAELLVKYFNKVVGLRETELHLHKRCRELELHAAEQKGKLREIETAMQHLALDADRRIIQLHKDNQKHIQLLLQELQKDNLGVTQQALHDRLQQVEKELFYYKSLSLNLKKKVKELFSGGPHLDNRPSQKPEHKLPEDNHGQRRTQPLGQSECGERLEMIPVRLNRRDVRQIFPADLQISGSATRRRQPAVETILEDSLEKARPADNTTTF
ncbi:kinesin-like protein KIF27 isoform X2 [Paralichthys olivaceus]|uniref:kinesin-like protein KIF27 isoform X2 n=1 Tax=Paralichthys olivaceus TaxID=8255 RepID=UPI003750EEBC